MGWRRLLIAGSVAGLVGACSFDPGRASEGVHDGSGDRDGGDGSDGPVGASCTLAPSGSAEPTPTHLGSVGSSNGNPAPDLSCPAGEVAVTAGFQSTVNPRPEGGNERVVVAINIGCASLALVHGSLVVTDDPSAPPPTTWTPNNCDSIGNMWTPFVTASAVGCPADQVLVGLHANGGPQTLFNTVTLACAAISPTGGIGAEDLQVAVTDTGSDSNNPQDGLCPAGEIVSSYAMRGNCGLDQLVPQCVALSCAD
jgi:hypothetical protein